MRKRNRGTRQVDQQSDEEAFITARDLQAELYVAAVYGDDNDRWNVAIQVLQWPPYRDVVRAWLSRMPRAMALDTMSRIESTISRNALNLGEMEDLEEGLRYVNFKVALQSPHACVITALGGKQCIKNRSSL